MTNRMPALTARTNIALESIAMERELDEITAEHDAMIQDGMEVDLLGMNDFEISNTAAAIALNTFFAVVCFIVPIL